MKIQNVVICETNVQAVQLTERNHHEAARWAGAITFGKWVVRRGRKIHWIATTSDWIVKNRDGTFQKIEDSKFRRIAVASTKPTRRHG